MEDDIFGEAGTDYKPAVPSIGRTAGPAKGGYFGQRGDDNDLPPIPSASELFAPPPPPRGNIHVALFMCSNG